MTGRGLIEWGVALPAPAKLNLFLHVIGRRADGYHLLQSAFRLIDCTDRITLEPRDDDRLVLATPIEGLADADHLAIRAAERLRAHARHPCGVTVRVDKSIPIGGGLGGGSSDAATTLIALDVLWDCRLGIDALAAEGLMLGADVPFFVRGANAFGEGVGEQLTPIDLPPAWYVVLTPPVQVPTGEIFGDAALTRDTPPVTIAAFFAGAQTRNDLEPVVRRRYPVVGSYLDWLGQFTQARLTGSGACVFGTFGHEAQARDVLERLEPDMAGFVAAGLRQHPLRQV
jgi:4-diphosphocytidyl-2-C-methyl-D-erythritol kinase